MTKTRVRLARRTPARRPLNRRPLNRRWTAGDVLSWVLGATLGLILGVTLLIVTARLTRAPGAETAPPASGSAEGIQATTPAPAQSADAADGAAADSNMGAATDTAADTATEETASEETATEEAADAQAADTEAAATPSPAEARPSEDSTAAAPATEDAVAGDAAAGGTKFASNCAACHGAQGQGGVGPALTNAAAWTDAEFLTTLREGKTPQKTLGPIMPRYTSGQLSDADVVNIHAYVKTLY